MLQICSVWSMTTIWIRKYISKIVAKSMIPHHRVISLLHNVLVCGCHYFYINSKHALKYFTETLIYPFNIILIHMASGYLASGSCSIHPLLSLFTKIYLRILVLPWCFSNRSIQNTYKVIILKSGQRFWWNIGEVNMTKIENGSVAVLYTLGKMNRKHGWS